MISKKMMEWGKRYPYRVKCLGCGGMLASEDKEDGYCLNCYRRKFKKLTVSGIAPNHRKRWGIVKMKTRKEHIKSLIEYWKTYYTDGGFPTLFDLKKDMIERNICPRCGIRSRAHVSELALKCYEDNCGVKITDKEYSMILDGKKGILTRKLKLKK